MPYSHLFIIFQPILGDVKPQLLYSKIPHYNVQHITQNYILKFTRHKNTYAWSKNLYTGRSCTQNLFLHSTAMVFHSFPMYLCTRQIDFFLWVQNTKTSSVWTAHEGKSLACTFMSCASDITKISTTVLILICCAVYNTETYFFRQHLKIQY